MWAHVGRISYETNAWLWTKIITDSVGNSFSVSALAVDSFGIGLAAHAHRPRS